MDKAKYIFYSFRYKKNSLYNEHEIIIEFFEATIHVSLLLIIVFKYEGRSRKND